MGSPGMGKGEVLAEFLLQQSREGAWLLSMCGTVAAVHLVEELEWIPPTVTPLHRRLAKSGGGGGGQGSSFTFAGVRCGRLRDGAGKSPVLNRWWRSCASPSLRSRGLEKQHPCVLVTFGETRRWVSGLRSLVRSIGAGVLWLSKFIETTADINISYTWATVPSCIAGLVVAALLLCMFVFVGVAHPLLLHIVMFPVNVV